MHELLKDKESLKEKLQKLYVNDEMSTLQIGKELDVDYKKITYWLHMFNINTRTYKQSNNLSFIKHRNLGNTGKKHSDETKLKIKEKLQKICETPEARKRLLESAKLGHKSCPRISSLEKTFEKKLIENNIEYESQFEYELGFADFKVGDKIIFIDGNYWHNYPEGTSKDRKQTKYLEEQGFQVVRIWESELKENINKCLDIVAKDAMVF